MNSPGGETSRQELPDTNMQGLIHQAMQYNEALLRSDEVITSFRPGRVYKFVLWDNDTMLTSVRSLRSVEDIEDFTPSPRIRRISDILKELIKSIEGFSAYKFIDEDNNKPVVLYAKGLSQTDLRHAQLFYLSSGNSWKSVNRKIHSVQLQS